METYTYEAYNVRTRRWSGVVKMMTSQEAVWRNAHLRYHGMPGRWFRRPMQRQLSPERRRAG